jgi:cytoskeleton protein RodZ
MARGGALAGGTSLVTPQAFGQQLRRHREKCRITLEQVATQTKVSASLFRSLENGDCARWPGGIYSRGFVRAYAMAIGVDPERAVEVFAYCYPELVAREFPDPPAEETPLPQTPLEKLKAALAAWFGTAAPDR